LKVAAGASRASSVAAKTDLLPLPAKSRKVAAAPDQSSVVVRMESK
jgi:hypothetical protein